MSSILQDVRLALRGFASRPGYSAALVATLALGIGASTAMFSLVDSALLRRLPFKDPDALVAIWGVAGPERDPRGASLTEALDWRAMNSTLTELSVYDELSLNLRALDGVERIDAELVSASYFPLLGASAALGRTFLPEEDRVPDAAPVIVISQDLWQRRFNGDSSAIGRTLTLNDRPFTIVGVMPQGFRGLSFDTHVWVPSMQQSIYVGNALYTSRSSRWLMTLGRLKPGVDSATAQRDLDAIGARLADLYPATNTDRSAQLTMLRENYLGQTRSLITTVFFAVLMLLVVACVNVAGLQLVRNTSRSREMALRLALGAGRGRLVRQLLVEGMVAGLAGGVTGAILASWILHGALPALPDGLLPAWVEPRLDPRALGFAFGVALAAGMFSAFVPALRSARADLTGALKTGVRSAASGLGRIRKPGAQQALVVAEVAVALMLLTGTTLMLRSLRAQLDVRPGFEAAGVTVASLSLPRERYPVDARARFATALAQQLREVPGVASASVSSDIPMGNSSTAGEITVPGRVDGDRIRAYRHSVTPGFFANLGIRLRAGRDFENRDVADAPAVVSVNDAMAQRFWPGEDAVGQRFRLGGDTGPEVSIIGVADNARFRDLTTDLTARTSEPDVYFPYSQRTDADIVLAARSSTGAPVSIELLQGAVSALDAGLPVFAVASLEDQLLSQSASPRFGSLALGAVSLFAILLCAIGIYGVIAFVVGMSRAEIAIRMALGADSRSVLRLIVGNGLALVAVGVVIGVAASLLLAPQLSELLFRVSPRDPLTLAVVTALVVTVAVVASWLPARRTLQIEPNNALRTD